MTSIRIIPRLDIKGPNVVKGIHMEGLRVLGKPEDFAHYYYESGADELIYMDAVASLYGRNSLLDVIEKTSRDIFIPLTVGGGLRTLDDIRTVLRAGADKVSINTAAIRHPEFISEAAKAFGSSTIVVSIEAIRKPNGRYEAYIDYGRESTGVDAVEWAVRAAQLGAGELIVTSIDREGTGKGFDLELTRKISDSVSIPVIASGGAGKLSDILSVITQGRADAVSIASLLHYDAVQRLEPRRDDFSEEGNIEFLKHKMVFLKSGVASLPDIKEYLTSHGLECRYPEKKSARDL